MIFNRTNCELSIGKNYRTKHLGFWTENSMEMPLSKLKMFISICTTLACLSAELMAGGASTQKCAESLQHVLTDIESLPARAQERHALNNSQVLNRLITFLKRQNLDGILTILRTNNQGNSPDYRHLLNHIIQNPRLLLLPEIRTALPEILCRQGILDDDSYIASLIPPLSRAGINVSNLLSEARQALEQQQIIESITRDKRKLPLARSISIVPARPDAPRALQTSGPIPGFNPVPTNVRAQETLARFLREFIPRRIYILAEPLTVVHRSNHAISLPVDVYYNRRVLPEKGYSSVYGGFGFYTLPQDVADNSFGQLEYILKIPRGARVLDSHTAHSLFISIRDAYPDFIRKESLRIVRKTRIEEWVARRAVEIDIAWELTGRPDIILGDAWPQEVIIRNPRLLPGP